MILLRLLRLFLLIQAKILRFWAKIIENSTFEKKLSEINQMQVPGHHSHWIRSYCQKLSSVTTIVANKKNFKAPFYGWGSTVSRLKPLRGGSLLLPLSSQKLLVLVWSTSEGWKTESTLEPLSGFEHGTPGLGIQHLMRKAFIGPVIPYSNPPRGVA